ncbi:MAG: hypothetical protein LBT11_02500, partial [Treponema sp.]|nr:hypothetical protein [Treponema sp.]
MGFWETNLAVVRECYPGLAEQLLAHDDEEGPELRVEAAGTGEPNLRAEGLHVHSPRDPDREGRRLAEAALAEAALAGASGPVIVLGFGLGYAASAASELAPQRPIIIVERRKAILRKALESRELRDFLRRGRLIFVLGGEPSGLTGVLGAVSGRAPGKSALLRNRALMQLDADWYAEAERHIGAWTAKDEVNRATLARFGKRWVRNLAANLGSIRDIPGLRGLEGILPGDIPALLVAAGPSLDRLI